MIKCKKSKGKGGDGTAVWAHTVVLLFLIRNSLATYRVVRDFFYTLAAAF